MSKITDPTTISSDISRDVSGELLGAFRSLLLERGFHRLSVRDIAEHAGVARSTFYEHFDGKDDLLKRSIKPLFSVLAECAAAETPPALLQAVVAHLWEQRELGRRLMRGAMADVVVPVLACEIEDRCLAARKGTRYQDPLLPVRLAAAEIAGAQIALLNAWDYSGVPCAPQAMAAALFTTSRALAKALFGV